MRNALSLRDLMNRHDAWHEVIVLTVSYAFILSGAWNDALLGFAPSAASRFAELATAAILAMELGTRIVYTQRRRVSFWTLAALDAVSLLTVFPLFDWIVLARVARMLYAAARLIRLLDRLAAERNNGMYLTAIFPFVVPLVAAAVFAIERHAPGSAIHNYGDALKVCLAFSLSLGNVRPASDAGMAVCGALFVMGLLTTGILVNTISVRYQDKQ